MTIDFDKVGLAHKKILALVTTYSRQATQARRASSTEDAAEFDGLADTSAELASVLSTAIKEQDAVAVLKLMPSIKALLGPINVEAAVVAGVEEAVLKMEVTKSPDKLGTYVALYSNTATEAHLRAIRSLVRPDKLQPADALKLPAHATVMYSKDANVQSLGRFKYELGNFVRQNTVVVKVGEPKFLGKTFDTLVLSLEITPEVQRLRDLCLAMGLKSNWPDFDFHVTLAYDLILDEASRTALLEKTKKIVKELDLTVAMFNRLVCEDTK